jgi:hypothetical protein
VKVVKFCKPLQELEIKKKAGTYNVYQITCSFGELDCLYSAISKNHADPLSDEIMGTIAWAMSGNIPMPGEDESEKDRQDSEEKAEKDAEKSAADRALPEPPSQGPDEPGVKMPPKAGPQEESRGPSAYRKARERKLDKNWKSVQRDEKGIRRSHKDAEKEFLKKDKKDESIDDLLPAPVLDEESEKESDTDGFNRNPSEEVIRKANKTILARDKRKLTTGQKGAASPQSPAVESKADEFLSSIDDGSLNEHKRGWIVGSMRGQNLDEIAGEGTVLVILKGGADQFLNRAERRIGIYGSSGKAENPYGPPGTKTEVTVDRMIGGPNTYRSLGYFEVEGYAPPTRESVRKYRLSAIYHFD